MRRRGSGPCGAASSDPSHPFRGTCSLQAARHRTNVSTHSQPRPGQLLARTHPRSGALWHRFIGPVSSSEPPVPGLGGTGRRTAKWNNSRPRPGQLLDGSDEGEQNEEASSSSSSSSGSDEENTPEEEEEQAGTLGFKTYHRLRIAGPPKELGSPCDLQVSRAAPTTISRTVLGTTQRGIINF